MTNGLHRGYGYGILLLLLLFSFGFVNEGFWVLAVIGLIVFAFILSVNISRHSLQSPQSHQTTIDCKPEPSPPIILPNLPDDLDNLLKDLSNGEIKDPVTQDIFRPEEKVYLCHVHRLAYHEDSWKEMGCRCMVCDNNSHTKFYVLPSLIDANTSSAQKKTEQITWMDI